MSEIREKWSRTTGRGLEFYQQLLGLRLEELNGKRLLNIGAGKSNIGPELEAQDIHPAKVVNVDLAYNTEQQQGLRGMVTGKRMESLPDNAVAADMRNLPFSAESFDTILHLWSLAWLNDEDKLPAIQEALRVCALDGEVKIFPCIRPNTIHSALIQQTDISFSRPNKDMLKLLTASTEQQSKINKLRQLLSNMDMIGIDAGNQLYEGVRGNSVGILTIRKQHSTEDLMIAIQDLVNKGMAF